MHYAYRPKTSFCDPADTKKVFRADGGNPKAKTISLNTNSNMMKDFATTACPFEALSIPRLFSGMGITIYVGSITV